MTEREETKTKHFAPKSLLFRYILCFHYQITSVLLGSVRPPKKSEMRFFLEDNGHELPNARWVSTGYLFSEHVFFQWNDMKFSFTKLPGRTSLQKHIFKAHHIQKRISKLWIWIFTIVFWSIRTILEYFRLFFIKNNLIG